MLATSDYGQELQEDLNAIVGCNEKFNNAIVGCNEKFNNAIVRHAMDTKYAAIMQNSNLLNLSFHDVKKFDLQNPVLGKIAAQVKASTDVQLRKILMQDGLAKIENRLQELKQPINFNDSDDETLSLVVRGGGDDGAPPPLPPTQGRSAESDTYRPLMRRLEELPEKKVGLECLADTGAVKMRNKKRSFWTSFARHTAYNADYR